MEQALQINGLSSGEKTGYPIFYLVFSFFSGVLETGVLTGGLMILGIPAGLVLVLAYQVGCLARNPLRFSLKSAFYALCCAVPLFSTNGNNLLLLVVAVLCLSSGLQSAREWLLPGKNQVSLSTKRLSRVSGFTFGILGSVAIGFNLLTLIAILAILVLLPLVFSQDSKTPSINLNKNFKSDQYGWIMMFHQTHYFAYAYILLSIFLSCQNQPLEQHAYWRPIIAALWFAMGWFSYISGKWLLKDTLKLSSLEAAIAGHTWVIICLILMVLFNEHRILLGLMWVVGGFGGGSVYALKDLAKENSCKADLELWEHWGHVVGVSGSLISVQLFPNYPTAPFVLAIIAAMFTLILLNYSTISDS